MLNCKSIAGKLNRITCDNLKFGTNKGGESIHGKVGGNSTFSSETLKRNRPCAVTRRIPKFLRTVSYLWMSRIHCEE